MVVMADLLGSVFYQEIPKWEQKLECTKLGWSPKDRTNKIENKRSKIKMIEK